MSTARPVDEPPPAEWAVESKVPGEIMEYTLLTGAGDAARAQRLFRTATTGTPNRSDAGMEALPWITFTGDSDGSAPILAAVERNENPERDGTGKLISPARLIVLPWPAE